MSNPGTEAHGIIRSDFPGEWPDDKKNAFTGEGLKEKEKEAQNYMNKLLNWRKQADVIHTEKLTHFAPYNGGSLFLESVIYSFIYLLVFYDYPSVTSKFRIMLPIIPPMPMEEPASNVRLFSNTSSWGLNVSGSHPHLPVIILQKKPLSCRITVLKTSLSSNLLQILRMLSVEEMLFDLFK